MLSCDRLSYLLIFYSKILIIVEYDHVKENNQFTEVFMMPYVVLKYLKYLYSTYGFNIAVLLGYLHNPHFYKELVDIIMISILAIWPMSLSRCLLTVNLSFACVYSLNKV